MKKNSLFPYQWYLKDKYKVDGIKKNGLNVFSTFSCGGGSSMGYKLAGFNVIAANDIDPKLSKVYQKNHDIKHFFNCPIKDLLEKELPKELYNIDILDGSPPCSTFSMAGSREKAFKKEKVFTEGQAKQVLSDLFYDFIDLADKIKPKVIIAENVKGMLIGNAKSYTKDVVKRLNQIGYVGQLFLLNAATMGVPQKRERVFFIFHKKELKKNKLKLNFSSKVIPLKELENHVETAIGKPVFECVSKLWPKCKPGKSLSTVPPKGSFFNYIKSNPNDCLPTIHSKSGLLYHYDHPNDISQEIIQLASTFPMDYDFLKVEPHYIMGMSVPPVMIASIANEIYKQWT